jgi:hypothetical protein
LYIVVCEKCGASNIKPQSHPDQIPNMVFCHRCNEIV